MEFGTHSIAFTEIFHIFINHKWIWTSLLTHRLVILKEDIFRILFKCISNLNRPLIAVHFPVLSNDWNKEMFSILREGDRREIDLDGPDKDNIFITVITRDLHVATIIIFFLLKVFLQWCPSYETIQRISIYEMNIVATELGTRILWEHLFAWSDK